MLLDDRRTGQDAAVGPDAGWTRTTAPGAIPTAGAAPVRRLRRRHLLSLAKLATACGIAGLGASAILSDAANVVSRNAVVSAPVIPLRTPVEGIVSAIGVAPGSDALSGQVVVRIDNPRLDTRGLVDLQQALDHADTDLAALQTQRDALRTLQGRLQQRADEYATESRSRLVGLLMQTRNQIAALAAQQEQGERDLARSTQLATTGAATQVTVEQQRSAVVQRNRAIAALAGQFSALREEALAAAGGTFLTAGGNDVSYSAQRADEVALRLVDLDRTISGQTAARAELAARLAAERQRVALLQSADVRAPMHGVIWKSTAATGEFVGAGETVAELIDCGAPVLLARVPQAASPEVEIGGIARFHLSGDPQERTGRVLRVTGGQAIEGAGMAAVPPGGTSDTELVEIAFTPPAGAAPAADGARCPVGRTARVLLPKSAGGGSLLQRLASLL